MSEWVSLNFSGEAIAKMIDFALKNGGAPHQIGNKQMVTEVSQFNEEKGRFEVKVESSPTPQKSSPTKSPTTGERAIPRICSQDGCPNMIESQDRRIKYCVEHTRSIGSDNSQSE